MARLPLMMTVVTALTATVVACSDDGDGDGGGSGGSGASATGGETSSGGSSSGGTSSGGSSSGGTASGGDAGANMGGADMGGMGGMGGAPTLAELCTKRCETGLGENNGCETQESCEANCESAGAAGCEEEYYDTIACEAELGGSGFSCSPAVPAFMVPAMITTSPEGNMACANEQAAYFQCIDGLP